MSSIERITKKLKEQAKSEKSYELIEKEDNVTLHRAQLLISEYRKTHHLKDMVLEEYAGTELEDIINSTIISNEYGEVLHKNEEINTRFPDLGCKDNIYSDLKLIYGIGPVREKKLKAKGYETIEDLKKHSKWGEKAESFMNNCYQKPESLFKQISYMKSASDPLVLEISDFYDLDDFVILDIETMGMANQPIILLGIGFPAKEQLNIHQFLLKDVNQEVAALKAFSDTISDAQVLLTYNGKSFDIPYIERRFNFYGLRNPLDFIHLDLLHFSRRAWQNELLNCRLNTIERQILHINREIDIPSALVPDFYQTYRETENPGPLVPILEHNKQDLLTLLKLFQKVYKQLSSQRKSPPAKNYAKNL